MTERLIAIGDIHGCATALAALLQAIRPTPGDCIVTLGDYINRGPDPKSVLEQLRTLHEQCSLVCLLGNHEEMLLAAIEGGQDDRRFFLTFGGKTTLAAYGVDDVRQIPREHVQFIKDCRSHYETVRHFFTHAYYEPHVPLDRQPWSSLIWAVLPRVPRPHCSGKTAIVGHTAQESGHILDLGFLKCIDTFCHGGGWLTALEVERGKVWQANQSGAIREA